MTALTVGPPSTGLREESTLYPREVLNPILPQSAPRLTLCGRADVMFRGRVARVWGGNILEMLLQWLLSFLAERRLPGNLGGLLSRAAPCRVCPWDLSGTGALVRVWGAWGPALISIPSRRVGAHCEVFQTVSNGAPQRRTSSPLIGWKEAGLGGLNVERGADSSPPTEKLCLVRELLKIDTEK